ncbi:arylsulfotransferase family protein [Alphaproteobacteria bacterium]|nr:arylsulfotransferase family protein [Alphaproteobacteria bacterium]
MFKKIEIWILYLIILLGILLAIGFGVLVRQEIEGITKKGNIDISFLSKPAAYIARLPEKALIKIFAPNPFQLNKSGTAKRYFYDQDGFEGTPNSQELYLLLSRYDGNLQEGVVDLVDLTNFKILHTWNPDIDEFNNLVEKVDEFKYLKRDSNNTRSMLRHPKLTQDGDLLFQFSTPLRKIDACSNLIFQITHNIFHHSTETDIDGNIWVPSHLYPQTLPIQKVGRKTPEAGGFLDDAIVKISPEGEILFEKSVAQILIDNGLEYLLFSIGNTTDPIHLNDIQPVDFDGEYWKKGDVFLSLRHQSMVLLYRPSNNKIIWKGTGPFFKQHDVDILNNHKVSILNNNTKTFIDEDVIDGHNEVIIYDFETGEYSSYIKDSLVNNDIRTITQGTSEILPNGDLFIEETNYGRTLFFNADGSLRWSHVNRAENGSVYSVGWSRILYTEKDLQTVNNFLYNRKACNE